MLREQVEAWIYRDPDDATRKSCRTLDTNQRADLKVVSEVALASEPRGFVALWVPVPIA